MVVCEKREGISTAGRACSFMGTWQNSTSFMSWEKNRKILWVGMFTRVPISPVASNPKEPRKIRMRNIANENARLATSSTRWPIYTARNASTSNFSQTNTGPSFRIFTTATSATTVIFFPMTV